MREIVFFTSNRTKLAHARYLCREYDVEIVQFREKTFRASYQEPRLQDRKELLEASYKNALELWSKEFPLDKIFFIEDTSAVVSALSTEGREFPGVDIKYWMKETDFSSLDDKLRAIGSDRRATVRCDLVLHVPPKLRKVLELHDPYLTFMSTSEGYITETEQTFLTNPMYPWLDSKSFNKWFVPNGKTRPISMLPIKQANKHDFRAPAFKEMLTFLEQHGLIHKKPNASLVQNNFDFSPPIFVVSGPTCAGKTTLAEHLSMHHGYCHVEASDFMYLSFYQRHGVGSEIKIGDFAERALREKPEIVAEQIVKHLSHTPDWPTILTGFRSPDEIEWFKKNYGGKFPVEVVYVTSDQKIRYERCLQRAREDAAQSFYAFRKRDTQQLNMGLGNIERSTATIVVNNDKTLERYIEKFEDIYSLELDRGKNVSRGRLSLQQSIRLENLILVSLALEWEGREFFTTAEIAHLINRHFSTLPRPKNKNNVSRYFNQTYHPYYEIQVDNGKRKYRLSNTGYGRALLLRGLNRSNGEAQQPSQTAEL